MGSQRRRDGGVRGSKHHLAVFGAAEFINFLRSLPSVGTVRDGPVTKKGSSAVDTICIRRSGDDSGKKNAKTKLKVLWGRTDGRQEIVVILRPAGDRHLLDVEAAALLEAACQEQYPDFKIVNDVQPPTAVKLPEVAAVVSGPKIGVAEKLPPVLPLPERQPSAESGEDKKIPPLPLSSARFRAYQQLLKAAAEEDDQLLFRGNLSQVVGGSQMAVNLIKLGLATRISKGIIKVERREVTEVLAKPRPAVRTALAVRMPALPALSEETMAEEIFRDPDVARDKIFRALLLGSNGVRSKSELEGIILVIDEVSASLKSVVESHKVAALVSQAMIDSAKELERPISRGMFGE